MKQDTLEHKNSKIDTGLWRKLLTILMEQKTLIYKLAAVMIFVAIIDVSFPILNKFAIDYFAIGTGSKQELIVFAIVYALLNLILGVSVYFYLKLAGRVEANFGYTLRKKAYEQISNLSFSYFDRTKEGWIIARMTSDIQLLSEIMSWSLVDVVYGVFNMFGVAIVMLWVNWKMALIVLIVVPFIAYASSYFQKKILNQHREVRAVNSQITGDLAESINGAKTIKTLGIEGQQEDAFKVLTTDMKQKAMRANLLQAIYIPIIISLAGFASAGILGYGGNLVLIETVGFGIGTLMMFTQYANQFFEPVRNIAAILVELQMAQASAERVLQLLEEQPEIVDTVEVIDKYGTILDPKPENYEPMSGDVEFKNIEFYYNQEEPVLENFNLKVNKGETIALVGETGSGKSTIVNLLCRFYEPISGQVLIDGKDYRERSIGWLHHHLGYVLQSPHLFSGSIKDNIRYGKLDATDEEIIEAAKYVNAHDFIIKFEEGYDFNVGEGGSRLSTGQKQLISFARAIIRDPGIFILDEATSSIDTETEQIIQYAIDKLIQDKTSFIVAHRLSTIVNADKILVIRNGKIEESGTHKELLAKEGYYYRLYTNQFKEEESRKVLEGDKIYA